LIGASKFGKRGNQLWTESNGHIIGEDAEVWDSMISEPRFDQYMKHYCFKDFRCFLPLAFQCEKLKEWQFQWAIDQFNQLRGDQISFIKRKPEPLGKLIVACLFFLI
jgi:hypothetical protein